MNDYMEFKAVKYNSFIVDLGGSLCKDGPHMKKIRFSLFFALIVTALCLPASVLAQRTATAVATVVNGFIIAVTVTDGGSGYWTPPAVTISGGGGSGAQAMASVTNGTVYAITVLSAGQGYTTNPTVSIAPPPFTDHSMIAYYPFNGNTKDESTNGHDATPKNITYTSDRFGNSNSSAYFNGQAAGVMVYDKLLNLSQPEYSIGFWFKPTTTQQMLSMLVHTIPGLGMALVYNNDHAMGYVSYFLGNAQNGWIVNWEHGTKNDYQDNAWYYVAFTKSNDVFRLYLNGTLDSSYTLTNKYDVQCGLRFGTTTEDLQQSFYGAMDDIRIFNYALSTNEINQYFMENAGQMDSDGDGLTDLDEVETYKTNPFSSDTDSDGLDDGYEVFNSKTNPLEKDSDFDGLSDKDEVTKYLTDPNKDDTDGDGFGDKQEIAEGSDPNDNQSFPKTIEISRAVKLHLKPIVGLQYQLQYSPDLSKWYMFEPTFVATTNHVYRFVEASTNNTYWRLQRIP